MSTVKFVEQGKVHVGKLYSDLFNGEYFEYDKHMYIKSESGAINLRTGRVGGFSAHTTVNIVTDVEIRYTKVTS